MFGLRITRRRLALGAAAVVVAGAALVPAAAMAQSFVRSAPVESGPRLLQAAPFAVFAGGGLLRDGEAGEGCGLALGVGLHGLVGVSAERLAANLGVTVEQLRDAAHAAMEAVRPVERPTFPPTLDDLQAKKDAFLAAFAAELGTTPEAVEAAIESARPTEDEIAAAKAETRAALEERLAQAVSAGRITQEQADAMLERFDAGARLFRLRGPHGFHFGGGGGFQFRSAPSGAPAEGGVLQVY